MVNNFEFCCDRKIKTISINICDKFWTIFSIDENNRLLIDEANLFTHWRNSTKFLIHNFFL